MALNPYQMYAIGSDIRKRLEARKEREAKRQALETVMNPPEREYQGVIPDDRGLAYKPEEQAVKLPESMVWEESAKKLIQSGIDPEKAIDFINTNRRLTVERYFTNALLSIKTNPQEAAQSLMKAYAHAGIPVYIKPDEQGRLVAFSADPQTGKIDPNPKLIDEDYLYKLKKLYQDKYDFGKPESERKLNEAKTEYYRAQAIGRLAGGRGATSNKPVKIDWAKFRDAGASFTQALQEGAYGEDIQGLVEENPMLATEVSSLARDLYIQNPYVVVGDREVELDPQLAYEAVLSSIFKQKLKNNLPVEQVHLFKKGKERFLTYGTGRNAITFRIPASLDRRISAIKKIVSKPQASSSPTREPKRDKAGALEKTLARKLPVNSALPPEHGGKTENLQFIEQRKRELLDEFFRRYGNRGR